MGIQNNLRIFRCIKHKVIRLRDLARGGDNRLVIIIYFPLSLGCLIVFQRCLFRF
jgi:hypothetical protein